MVVGSAGLGAEATAGSSPLAEAGTSGHLVTWISGFVVV